MQRIESIEGVSWTEVQEPTNCDKIIDALEQGKIVFFPHLTFHIEKKELLSTNTVSENRKNVSYDSKTQCLSGCTKDAKKQADLKALMRSFAEKSKILVETALPHYRNHLMIGRTSFRPIEIEGREAPSYRKDDKLLHVDAFPSTPVQGFRILRVFSNINPDGKPRIWRIGEPFENVVKTFLPQLKRPLPGSAMFLKMLRITRQYRTLYDHFMLQLHHMMKKDSGYQREVSQEVIPLPAHSTWMVYTDVASHAAMAGQHVLEQTFYLPVHAMRYPERAPVNILSRYLKKTLCPT